MKVKKSVLCLILLICLAFCSACGIQFGKSKIYVVFNSNGGTPINTVEVEEGTAVEKPPNPYREGWVFVGWFHGDKLYDFTRAVTRTITLSARWVKEGEGLKYYSVTFTGEGVEEFEQSVVQNGFVQKPNDPTLDGFEFLGWYLGDDKFNFANPIDEDIILVAKWQEIEVIAVYTVTFDSNGGSAVNPQKVEENSFAKEPSVPTRVNYDFAGWYLGEELYDFSTPITCDITLMANWTKSEIPSNYFVVTFNSNGGTFVESQSVKEGECALVPTSPTKEGYNFIGWAKGGEDFDFSEPILTNIILDAVWEEVIIEPISYEVKFDSNGGSEVASQIILEGDVVIKPTDPTLDGYEFLGWFVGDNEYDFSQFVYADFTLTAMWTKVVIPLKIFVVTFDFDYDYKIETEEVEEGSSVAFKEVEDREGYSFAGWYFGETEYNFSNGVYENITLKAKWTKHETSQFENGTWIGTEDVFGEKIPCRLVVNDDEKYFEVYYDSDYKYQKIEILSITFDGSYYYFKVEDFTIKFTYDGNILSSEFGINFGNMILTKSE